MHERYRATVDQIQTWGAGEDNVTGAIVIGSQVRPVFGADRWSDLDLMLVAHDRQRLQDDHDWLAEFGQPLAVCSEVTPLSWLDWDWCVVRVLYQDGRDLDFSLVPEERLQQGLETNGAILAMGHSVVYDAQPGRLQRLIESLPPSDWPPPRITGAGELQRDLQNLFHHLVGACKKIRRGEVWVGVSTLNGPLMMLLLKLSESYLDAVGAAPSVLEYEGRFLEQRLDPPLAGLLAGCAAHYDAQDAWRAARCQLEAAHWLAARLAHHLGHTLAEQPFTGVAVLLDDIIAG